MAARKTKTTEAEVTKALNPQDSPERFRMGELGYSGMSIFSGITEEELYRELTFPNSLTTYKKMSYHTSINSCLNLYESLISKVSWKVVPPDNATEAEKEQTKFVNECLEDMEIPLRRVIKDSLSSNIYGFSVLEKVYRKRLKSNGSMFNDGKIGIKKIAVRNQESISNFVFSDDGNEVLGVKQNVALANSSRYSFNKTEVVIPRKKYIHITTGRNREDPYGVSPLRDAWLSYTYLVIAEEMEASGVSRDLSGLPVLRIPAQYMSADASPEQKLIYESFKNIIRNIQMNSQSGLVLPSDQSPESNTPLFDFELMAVQGNGKSYAIDKIKQYFQTQIYTALGCDLLILGNTGVGSFALGQLKSTLTGAAIEAMLDNIVESFNRDLIRQLYEFNDWDVSRACKLDYDNLHAADLETISKFGQRLGATGMLPKNHNVINYFLNAAGIDPIPDSEDLTELLGESTTRSGDGMNTASGGLNGTSASVSGSDNSVNNADNTA